MKAIHKLLALSLFPVFTAGLCAETQTAPAPIPFSELGAKATADYKGDAIGIAATRDALYLESTFQPIIP